MGATHRARILGGSGSRRYPEPRGAATPWPAYAAEVTDRRARPTAAGSPGDVAIVDGMVATGLLDVTDDLAALDGEGWWTVVAPFDRPPVLARFADLRPLRPGSRTDGPWRGPDRSAWRSSIDEAGFAAAVEDVRGSIARGDVYQVNLTRRLSAPIPPDASMVALGAALARSHPAPYAAVVELPRHGVRLASASPELFLERDGARVRSSPIKGTAPTPSDLLAKDAAENVMIVDLVRNDLGRVCRPGSIHVPHLLDHGGPPGPRAPREHGGGTPPPRRRLARAARCDLPAGVGDGSTEAGRPRSHRPARSVSPRRLLRQRSVGSMPIAVGDG